ncbi:MAG: hypothetical protein WA982_02870 [Rubrobacteraceae bacterium]
MAEKVLVDGGQEKQRYLLFDSGCSTCTDVAHSVEQETDGWLTARSLQEDEVQAQLTKARPNWKWEPALMEVEGDEILVFTGLQMKMRMLVGLGPRKTARIAKIVRRAGAGELNLEMTLSPSKEDPESYTIDSIKHIDRRTALKRMAAVGLGAALLPALPQSVLAQEGTTTEEENRDSSGARVIVRTKKMTRRRARRAFAVARKSGHGSKLHRHLGRRKFLPDTANIAGGYVTTQKALAGDAKVIKKTWYVLVNYKNRGTREKALFGFHVTKTTTIAGSIRRTTRKVKCDHSIFTRSGGLDAFAVRKGRVRRTLRINDLAAFKRRRLGSEASFLEDDSRTSQVSCTRCKRWGSVIVGLSCSIAFTALAGMACPGIAVWNPVLGAVCPYFVTTYAFAFCGANASRVPLICEEVVKSC